MYNLGSRESFLIRPYFPYCESTSFVKLNFGKPQHSVIASFCTIVESLTASSGCI